jgi:hypothetical protein
MPQASSGITAVSTSGDTAVDVISSSTGNFERAVVHNTGAAAGFFSVDGGTIWHHIPAAASMSVTLPAGQSGNPTIKVKRIASGTNMSGVYASLF